MPNTITHKKSTTASAVPSGASLSAGEIAINTADGRLFIKKSDGTVVAIGRNADELNTGTVAAARLPAATGSTLGAIIVGTGLGVASGTVSVSYGSTSSTACVGNDARLSDARTPLSHTHGNITNAGAIGSTANLPIITTTSGVLTAGSFGTTASTFCQGNDSRLSDARTPLSHTHGNITNAGAIGTTSGQIVVTTTSGVLTTAATIAAGSVSGLATSATTDTTNATNISSGTLNSARLPTIGNITNAGAIGSTANLPVITTTSGVLTTGTFGTAANSFCQGNDARLACQAWVNFNATSSAALSGTYSQSGGTTLTCTVTAHGLANNQIAWLTFTSGTAASSAYVVTVTGANTFTIQTTAATTSGNVSVMRRTIRASNNVSSVAYNTVGDFFVNFATAMSDANYAAVITPGGTANAFLARAYDEGTARTTMALRILCVTLAAGNATIDPANVSVAVFR